MWNCQHCGADVQDDRETCWNCQWDKNGSPPENPAPWPDMTPEELAANAPEPAAPICLRCGTSMDFQAAGALNLQSPAPIQRYELFVCGRCGHLELFDGDIRRGGPAGEGST